ncbi:MAG: futalosine hydrolase [Desulfamplus sp.]|nr:futalosine hydrolase [Desulfamplus sp.]
MQSLNIINGVARIARIARTAKTAKTAKIETFNSGDLTILVLAATEMEITPLLKQSTILSNIVSKSGKKIVVAKFLNTVFTLIITGIGVINTAHALTVAIETVTPDIIIQVGIGGAFEEAGVFVGDIAVAESETYIHTGVEAFSSYNFSYNFSYNSSYKPSYNPLYKNKENYSEKEDSYFLKSSYPHHPLPFDLLENHPRTREGLFYLNMDHCKEISEIINKQKQKQKQNQKQKQKQKNYNHNKNIQEDFNVISGKFITVSTITSTISRSRALFSAFSPCIESMEGAAAAHVATIYNLPLIEIRAASNLVGVRDKSRWNIPLAVERLFFAITALFSLLKN